MNQSVQPEQIVSTKAELADRILVLDTARNQVFEALQVLRANVGPFAEAEGYEAKDIDHVRILDGDVIEIGIDYEYSDGEKDYRIIDVPMAIFESPTAIKDWQARLHQRTLQKQAEAAETQRRQDLAQLSWLKSRYPDADGDEIDSSQPL